MWREIRAGAPDSFVLLSTRESAHAWWQSFSATILPVMRRGSTPETATWHAMAEDMLFRFSPHYSDPTSAMTAYNAHNQAVRDVVDPGRLIEWRSGDGWSSICDRLGLPQPDEPFPHVNTTDEFRAMAGLTGDNEPAP
jgi:hypothetical protein